MPIGVHSTEKEHWHYGEKRIRLKSHVVVCCFALWLWFYGGGGVNRFSILRSRLDRCYELIAITNRLLV
jgi:hypothetical protein